jgi:predicted RNA binding protein YcfA (HicA-like mRNA interferase family)
MSKHDKLLQKAKNNHNGFSFKEFETVMGRCGWVIDHQSGSHQIWYSPKGHRISVQSRNGKAKGYQVKQFLMRLEEETKHA